MHLHGEEDLRHASLQDFGEEEQHDSFSIIEVVGDIDGGWSITNHERGLPTLLLELLIQPEECTASGKGARPPARGLAAQGSCMSSVLNRSGYFIRTCATLSL